MSDGVFPETHVASEFHTSRSCLVLMWAAYEHSEAPWRILSIFFFINFFGF